MTLTKVSYSMIKGAPANVLDFGADASGLTDSTQAFKNAFAASYAVYVPAGTYLISDTLSLQDYGYLYGDGPNKSRLKCNTSAFTGVFLSVGGRSQVENICLAAFGPRAGTGVRYAAKTGEYDFTGHSSGINIQASGFAVGIDVNNFFDLFFERCECFDNGIGLRLLPSYNPSFDSGYYTTVTVFKCYLYNNVNEGFKSISTINSRVLHFIDTVVEFNGGTFAEIDITRCFYVSFSSCYSESSTNKKWLRLEDVSECKIDGHFAISTGGVTLGESGTRFTVVNSAIGPLVGASVGAVGQSIYAYGSSIGATTLGSTVRQQYINSSVNSTSQKDLRLNNELRLTDDVSNTSTLNKFSLYTKTVTATISGNNTGFLIYNSYLPGVFEGDTVAIASITNLCPQGLILQVTPSDSGDKNYISVLATNTTSSPITLTNAQIKIAVLTGYGMAI